MHSAGVFIILAAGKARKPMTRAPSILPEANWKPHIFINTYLVICPAAAIEAHRGNTLGDGLLMLENPIAAIAAKIPSFMIRKKSSITEIEYSKARKRCKVPETGRP